MRNVELVPDEGHPGMRNALLRPRPGGVHAEALRLEEREQVGVRDLIEAGVRESYIFACVSAPGGGGTKLPY